MTKRKGRKPKHGKAMVPLVARVPPEVKAEMIAYYGGVQAAIDVLIIERLLPSLSPETQSELENKK